jgi:hypothetical protein
MIELEPPMNRASFRLFPHLNNGVGKLSGVLNKPATVYLGSFEIRGSLWKSLIGSSPISISVR